MTKKFLLVCEGPSDIPIFDRIAKSLGGEIIEFSPVFDATSNNYPPHGWTAVQAWCRRQAANSSVGDPIDFWIDWKKADGLIIQMDTDIAHLITIGGNIGVAGDKQWCSNALDSWLGSRSNNSRKHYILSSHSTETWIVATYSNSRIGYGKGTVHDYESIPNPQSILLSLGYKKDGKNGLLKNYKQYEKLNYSPRVVAHLSKARMRCAELDKLIKLF